MKLYCRARANGGKTTFNRMTTIGVVFKKRRKHGRARGAYFLQVKSAARGTTFIPILPNSLSFVQRDRLESGKAVLKLGDTRLTISEADPHLLTILLDLVVGVSSGLIRNTPVHGLIELEPAPPWPANRTSLSIYEQKKMDDVTFAPKLILLVLENCGLEEIDERLFGLRGLRRLSLRRNELGKDSVSLNRALRVGLERHWTLLEELDLACNRITLLEPRTLAALPVSLSELDVSDNKLTSFPLPPGKMLPNLRKLDISRNKISWIPSTIASECPGLSRFVLCENLFHLVPGWILSAFDYQRFDEFYHYTTRMNRLNALLTMPDVWAMPFDPTRSVDTSALSEDWSTWAFDEDNDDDDDNGDDDKQHRDTALSLGKALALTGLTQRDWQHLAESLNSQSRVLDISDERPFLGAAAYNSFGRLPPLGLVRNSPPSLLAMAYTTFMNSPFERRRLESTPDAIRNAVLQSYQALAHAIQVCSICMRLCSPWMSFLINQSEHPFCGVCVSNETWCAHCAAEKKQLLEEYEYEREHFTVIQNIDEEL